MKLRYTSFIILFLIGYTLPSQASVSEISSLLGSANPETFQTLITNHSWPFFISIFFIIGLLLSLTPCVLPMLPVLSSIIAGQHQPTSKKATINAVAYVLGMAISYAITGILAGLFGHSIQAYLQQPIIITFTSVIFILMGLSLMGIFELQLPNNLKLKLQKQINATGKSSFVNLFIIGMLSMLILSPCVSAPLVGVLSLISHTGNAGLGGMLLFIMALGMGLPLILIAAGQGAIFPKAGPWMDTIKKGFALLMFAMAVWMLGRVVGAKLENLLWCVLVLGVSIFWGALNFRARHTAAEKLTQTLSIVLLTSSLFFFITQLVPKQVPLPSLSSAPSSNLKPVKQLFQPIRTPTQLSAALEKARIEKKAVFLDFFASWCSDCKAMDQHVFTQAQIQSLLNRMTALRVDISVDNALSKAFKKQYAIYGTPTLIFFNQQGKEIKTSRQAGFVSTETLSKTLKDLH